MRTLFAFAALLLILWNLPSQAVAASNGAVVRIAIPDNYPPYTVRTPMGRQTGLLAEMWRAWGVAVKREVLLVPLSWTESLQALRNGDVHIHAGMFRTAEREEWADFSEAIHQIESGTYVRAESAGIMTLADLSGLKVGVLRGGFQESYLKKNYTTLQLVPFESGQAMVTALLTGEVEGLVHELPALQAEAARLALQGAVRRLDQTLLVNSLHATVRKGDRNMLDLVDLGFKAIEPQVLVDLEKRWLNDPADRFYIGMDGKIVLSAAEQAWLDRNPVIRMAVTDFINPIDILTGDGTHDGFNADLMTLLNRKLGANIVPEIYSKWGDVVENVKSGKVEAGFSLSRTPDREKHILFTKPYAFDSQIVVVRKDTRSIRVWGDLKGKKVSVLEGLSVAEDLEALVGHGEIVRVENETEGLVMLAAGEVDAHAGFLIPYGNTQRDTPVAGLRIGVTRNVEGGTLRIGVHKSHPQLHSILRKGLNAVTREEMTGLLKKWIYPSEEKLDIDIGLTAEEKAWVAEAPRISVAATADWPPFEENSPIGGYQGISADFIRAAAERAGLELDIRFAPWDEQIAALKAGEIDVAPGVYETEERRAFLDFTRPFVEMFDVVWVRNSEKLIRDVDDLAGRIVAVEKGYAMEEMLRTGHPEVGLVLVENALQALQAVSTGQADAYVGNQVVVAHMIRAHLLQNLKSVAFYGDKPSYMSFGIAKGRGPLRNILDKALASLSPAERSEITGRHVALGRRALGRQIDLTEEEKRFLAEHPRLRVHNETDWPPFNFNQDGRPQGYSIAVMNLLAERLGVEVAYVSGPSWDEFLEMMRNKDLDVMLNIIQTPEREAYLHFTESFVENPSVIVVNENKRHFRTLADLNGHTVAVPKGFYYVELLRREYPEIRILETEDQTAALNAVSVGDAEATVAGVSDTVYLIRKLALSNLKVSGNIEDLAFNHRMRLAVRDDWPILRDILNKALNSITAREIAGIHEEWLGGMQLDEREMDMSPEERVWLSKLGSLKLGIDPAWPPFEFLDEKGAYSGISSGFSAAVADLLNVRMFPAPDLTWNQVIEGAKNESIDVVPAVVKTPDREAFLNFTRPYISFPAVIVNLKDGPFIAGIGDLKGMKIGVVDGYAVHEHLRTTRPDLDLVPQASLEEGLEQVTARRIDAFIGNLAAVTYVMDKEGLAQLRVAAPIDYSFDLAMGVRKGLPELVPLLQRALDTLTEEDKRAIKNRWVTIQYNIGLDMTTVLLWVLPAAGGAVLIIVGIVAWNRRLGNEIAERKRAEKKLSFTQYAVDNAAEAVFWVRPFDMGLEYVNETAGMMLGFTRDELLTMHMTEFDLGLAEHRLDDVALDLEPNAALNFETLYRTKGGKEVDVLVSVYMADYLDRQLLVANVKDITLRKKAEEELKDAYNVISGSIRYASRIQRSVLPDETRMAALFDDYFILWEPRDVVGGDIYWWSDWGDGAVFALGDCTGHGVPGAFMTLITTGALDRALSEVPIGDPAALVRRMHQMVQETLSQKDDGGESDDGMELGVCYLSGDRRRLRFVGARFDLYTVEDGAVRELKGVKKGIGYRAIPHDQVYDVRDIDIRPGTAFYMTTDGLIDQVGGARRRTFGKKRFKELLGQLDGLHMREQRWRIQQALNAYQASEARRDDVAVIGFRL